MKTFIKTYVLSALFLVALTTEANAQSKRGKEVKIVSKTKTINKKIPRTKVTYKKQKKK